MGNHSPLLHCQRTLYLLSHPALKGTFPCLGKTCPDLLDQVLRWAVKVQALLAQEIMILALMCCLIGPRITFPRGQMFLYRATSPLNGILRTVDTIEIAI